MQCKKGEKPKKSVYPVGSYGYDVKKKSLHKACWKIVSDIVRRNGEDCFGIVRCYTCGNQAHWKTMDCGHVEHAGNDSFSLLDFYFDGLRTQCKFCNHHGKGKLDIFAPKLIREIGQKRFNKIKDIKHLTNIMTHEDYKKLKIQLKEKIKEIYGESNG